MFTSPSNPDQARDPTSLDQVQISMVLLGGRLHLVYSIYGRSGVYEVTSDEFDDGRWHRVVLGLERRNKNLILFVDNMPAVVSFHVLNHVTSCISLSPTHSLFCKSLINRFDKSKQLTASWRLQILQRLLYSEIIANND